MREGGSKKKKTFSLFSPRLHRRRRRIKNFAVPRRGCSSKGRKMAKKKCMRMTRFERAAVRWQRLYGSVGLASLGLAPFSGGGRSTAELHPLLSLAHELKRDLSK